MQRRSQAKGADYDRILKEQAREERQSGYTQPLAVSWREFLKERGWTPDDVDALPDDWLYAEWQIYVLRIRYQIGR